MFFPNRLNEVFDNALQIVFLPVKFGDFCEASKFLTNIHFCNNFRLLHKNVTLLSFFRAEFSLLRLCSHLV